MTVAKEDDSLWLDPFLPRPHCDLEQRRSHDAAMIMVRSEPLDGSRNAEVPMHAIGNSRYLVRQEPVCIEAFHWVAVTTR